MKKLYRSNGQYLGFISQQGNIYLWNGEYLGWVDEQDFAWDKNGTYKGKLQSSGVSDIYYVCRNMFEIAPIAKKPKAYTQAPALPSPSAPIAPVQLGIGVVDGF